MNNSPQPKGGAQHASQGEPRYRAALREALQWITLESGSALEPEGERYPFQALYQPFRIDDGSFAAKSYAEVLERLERAAAGQVYLPHTDSARDREDDRKTEWSSPSSEEPTAPEESGVDLVRLRHKLSHALAARPSRAVRQQGLQIQARIHAAQTAHSGAVPAQASSPETASPAAAEQDGLSNLAQRLRARLHQELGKDTPPPPALPVLKSPSESIRMVSRIQNRIQSFLPNSAERDAKGASWENAAAENQRKLEEDLSWTMEDAFFEEANPAWAGMPLVADLGRESRVLALGGAGLGKTTLLRRLALFYSQREPGAALDAADQALAEAYALPLEPLLPILLPCREVEGPVQDFSALLEGCVSRCLEEYSPEGEAGDLSWLAGALEHGLLLVDGLDELPDGIREGFLLALARFLKEHPCPVVATSRVAGLLGVRDALSSMGFRYRTLMPLTEEAAADYARRWLCQTQDPAQVPSLLTALETLLAEEKYAYLRDFMRTPLELTIILQQLVRDEISLNRHQLFYDLFWSLFTRHTPPQEKAYVFKDTMTFMGWLAYEMLQRDRLYIPREELGAILEEARRFSFHQFPESPVLYIDRLIAHTGIMEKSGFLAGTVYSFPIRAYQEFLCAYACCHLRLLPDASRPEPAAVLAPHLGDSRWMQTVNFALADLENSGAPQREALVEAVIQASQGSQFPMTLLEAEMSLPREHVRTLCRQYFSRERITNSALALLDSCMKTRSANTFLSTLRKEFEASQAAGQGNYTSSCIFAHILWDLHRGRDPFQEAGERLRASPPETRVIGAWSLLKLGHVFAEDDFVPSLSSLRGHGPLPADIPLLLRDALLQDGSLTAAEALVELRWAGLLSDESSLDAPALAAVSAQITALFGVIRETSPLLLLEDASLRETYQKQIRSLERWAAVAGGFPLSVLFAAKLPHPEGLAALILGLRQTHQDNLFPLSLAYSFMQNTLSNRDTLETLMGDADFRVMGTPRAQRQVSMAQEGLVVRP